MMTTLKIKDLPGLFASVAAIMDQKADELCAMDAKLGDGDLGLTMKKGFGAMPELLAGIDEADMGKKLMKAGMKMASVVPSTMGTLMASGIMSGGKAIAGGAEMDAKAFCDYLRGFAAGIVARGKCARGDRTVLDAIGAAADEACAALSAAPELTLAGVAEAALKGAKEGVEATRSMAPKFGKAAVHQAAAVGTVDQGACAGCYMIQGYRDFICG